jgi:flagellar biosynthesis protein FlhG
MNMDIPAAALVGDQADGLRRLLAPARPHAVAVGAVAGHALAIELAVTMSALGKNVLLLDAAGGASAPVAWLGVEPPGDLLDAARGTCSVDEAACPVQPSLRCMAAWRLFDAAVRLTPADEVRLEGVMAAACAKSDLVLIASARPAALALGDALLLAIPADVPGVTAGYRLLKQLNRQYGLRAAHVLLGPVRSSDDAVVLATNLARTALQFLGMPVSSLGGIADDQWVRRSGELRQPVVELFPSSPAAETIRACADALLRVAQEQAAGLHSADGQQDAKQNRRWQDRPERPFSAHPLGRRVIEAARHAARSA